MGVWLFPNACSGSSWRTNSTCTHCPDEKSLEERTWRLVVYMVIQLMLCYEMKAVIYHDSCSVLGSPGRGLGIKCEGCLNESALGSEGFL